MTKFRGCIDIHAGKVKQIVGGTLSDSNDTTKTNFVSSQPPQYYGKLYENSRVEGTHVIKLGPGCDEAAIEALSAWPHMLQVGGGINDTNARQWIEDYKASKVIVTSYLFPDAKLSMERLLKLEQLVGRDKLVVDLSCRRVGDEWVVAMNRWQTLTDTKITKETLDTLAGHCSEFLIHAADVEGLCRGIDEELVKALGQWVTIPTTYAGGARNIGDLALVEKLSNGKIDLTFGSALDIFGGSGVTFAECIDWNNSH
ncbi:1-(5-phosphoribosyl)-5-[(5-phosphoribosylamino)methylideneamino] imidazole-4-carboxamide isomerase [Trichomonascus vanleenenianus]|uniref:1-(5-phosphoribosyl)-5- ((5-phosphoribosylamino)methylideneamino)imidazole-4- carboxamide isomerase HIS6 n=1 Tax=Trichomonascus vanleenenianus TaxID=2268995 RepID=UPI003ECA8371